LRASECVFNIMQTNSQNDTKSLKDTNLFCGDRRFNQPSKTRAVVFL